MHSCARFNIKEHAPNLERRSLLLSNLGNDYWLHGRSERNNLG